MINRHKREKSAETALYYRQVSKDAADSSVDGRAKSNRVMEVQK